MNINDKDMIKNEMDITANNSNNISPINNNRTCNLPKTPAILSFYL
jgi:hypothetical protein